MLWLFLFNTSGAVRGGERVAPDRNASGSSTPTREHTVGANLVDPGLSQVGPAPKSFHVLALSTIGLDDHGTVKDCADLGHHVLQRFSIVLGASGTGLRGSAETDTRSAHL